MDTNVGKCFSTYFDSVELFQTAHKTPPESSLKKPRFRVKSKMAAIKLVIYIYFLNRYDFRTKHQQVTNNKNLLLMIPVWGTWQKSQESAGAM